jgi:RNA polymerase sigma-70 factor (ECF subfamily)
MSQPPQSDALLVQRIRKGQPDAWSELIDRFEGRLLAFVESRLRDRASGEDVVQETFIGFLTSLPNFDSSRPLEGYLFSIAAHKLTDFLRRQGRRPAIPLSSADGASGEWELPGKARPASSILRSGERRGLEEQALAQAIKEQVGKWREKGDWIKLSCMELLFIRGAANKDVSVRLELTEQQVANFKFDFLARLRSSLREQKLSPEVFPELHG